MREGVMTSLQVRDTLNQSLASLIALPDAEAATALNDRMGTLKRIEELYEVSYSERVVIIREFELRRLWTYLIDEEVGQPFATLTAWLSSGFLGCRRVNMEAHRDIKHLADVPAEKLIDVKKGNLKLLTQLSTAVRNQPDVLEAARTMPREAFEEKVEIEHPQQHIETRKPMRFTPGRSWARKIEEAIAYALEHDIAGSRDEALLRMAETALDEWYLDEELKSMPKDEVTA